MLFLTKLAGILVIVWFYLTGKKQGQNAIKWAVIGSVGYWLAWWIGNALILSMLVGMFSKKSFIVMLVTQIPVTCGLVAAFFVRKKLIKDVEKTTEAAE